MGTLKELETTMEWLYALPHPVKMYILSPFISTDAAD
jgi:hypothetical protein